MTKLLPDFVLLHAGELTGLPRASRALPSIIEHVEIAHPARYFLGRILLTSPSSRGPPTDRTDAVSVRFPFIFFFFLGFCPLVAFGVTSLPVAEPNGGEKKEGREEGGSRRVGNRGEEPKDGRGGGAELQSALRLG